MGKTFYLQAVTLIIFIMFFCNTNAQWVHTNEPSTGSVYCFTVRGPNIFAGTQFSGVLLSTDDGINWFAANKGLLRLNYPYSVTALAVADTNIFAGTERGGIFRSTNNGTSWSPVNNGLQNYTNFNVVSLVVDSETTSTNIFAVTETSESNAVFRSTNYGTGWTALNTNGYSFDVITPLKNDNTGINLFAGAQFGGIFMSTNEGLNWISIDDSIQNILTLAASGKYLYAGATDGMFISTNSGTSWNNVSSKLNFQAVFSIAVDDTNIFIGIGNLNNGNGGVLLSTDNGTIWRNISSGLPNDFVEAIYVNGTDLYAGTIENGIWKIPINKIVNVVNTNNDLLRQYSLLQNYPNPFNPTTTIKYSVPNANFVTIKIYDVLGREIKTLVNEEKPAGSYEVEFNGSKYPSGIYFYRIQAGSYSSVKKMILMK